MSGPPEEVWETEGRDHPKRWGTFPSPVKRDRGRGIETFGAPSLALPQIGS